MTITVIYPKCPTIKIRLEFQIFRWLKVILEVECKSSHQTNRLEYDSSTYNSTSIDGSSTNNGSINYIIRGLEEDSSYTITVTAHNAAGSLVSVPVTGRTMEAGEILLSYIRSIIR